MGMAAMVDREPANNVIGTELRCCCADVRGSGIGTGFYRDGFCSTGIDDEGRHTVCIKATDRFLAFSAAAGNPLHVPIREYAFPGVQPGDRWCLCAARYAQVLEAEASGQVKDQDGQPFSGFTPQIYLLSTHEKTLQYVPLEKLMEYAIDAEEAQAELDRLVSMRDALEDAL
jgi:uncharacterized protein (DUF2237 family)